MEKEARTFPIPHLSYSALTQLLRNPLIFKMKHILGVYSGKIGVSGVIGIAGHRAMQAYYGGDDDNPVEPDMTHAEKIELARWVGLQFIEEYDESSIEYGKTGSREQILKGFAKAMEFYFAEEPQYDELMFVEERMEAALKTVEGQLLPLPATGKTDIVHKRKDGLIEIIDHKFVKTFTNHDDEDGIKIIQAMFYFHLLLAAHGIRAHRMVFREVKYSANKDGGPQIRDWVVPFDHEPYFIIFYNLYRDVIRYLSVEDQVFLPNVGDIFDGKHSWLLYSQGLISSDMSDVEVMHKVRDVAFKQKSFVPSSLDKDENKDLLPEERVKLRLAEFGIPVIPVDPKEGPSVTQYRFKVSSGVRMSSIKKHKDDIARALEAKGHIKIVAPIPGTNLVGVEVERKQRKKAKLLKKHLRKGTLDIPVGMNVDGEVVHIPLNEAPHVLAAGATGTGKSIFLNTTIEALTEQLGPEELKLVLVDPKRVELSHFEDLPHLMQGIVYEQAEAVDVLAELVAEMEERFRYLKKHKVRNIQELKPKDRKEMPYIVLVIDEFADLMLQSEDDGGSVAERLIVRLGQMARAVGIHLIIATQRPSVDVVTGLIKANFPTRVAMTTSSPTDSKVILGQPGAELLHGKGDMLLMYPGMRGEVRLQGLISE